MIPSYPRGFQNVLAFHIYAYMHGDWTVLSFRITRSSKTRLEEGNTGLGQQTCRPLLCRAQRSHLNAWPSTPFSTCLAPPGSRGTQGSLPASLSTQMLRQRAGFVPFSPHRKAWVTCSSHKETIYFERVIMTLPGKEGQAAVSTLAQG